MNSPSVLSEWKKRKVRKCRNDTQGTMEAKAPATGEVENAESLAPVVAAPDPAETGDPAVDRLQVHPHTWKNDSIGWKE